MVSHGVPCCFGARNIIITAMMNYCNVWCLKSLVPLGSGMKNDVLDQQKPIQRFKHFYSGVPLGLSAKTKTNHDIFDLVISVCHWGNPVARTFARTHFATVCHAVLDKNRRLARTSAFRSNKPTIWGWVVMQQKILIINMVIVGWFTTLKFLR